METRRIKNKCPFGPYFIMPNALNEQIIKNVARHSVPIAYPIDLRIFIPNDVMPEFMAGKISAAEVASMI
jgi:hypothetical protein